MPLILAIEPDRRQAAQLKRLVRGSVDADLVLADTTELALEAIGDRIPDLVLVPALLSPQDDAALATALRVIAAAARVQTLTIPVFAGSVAPTRGSGGGGVLAKWRRSREQPASPEGCDPGVFAEQIAAYLAEGAAVREAQNEALEEYEPPVTQKIVEPFAAADEPTVEPWAEYALELRAKAALEPWTEPAPEPQAEFALEPRAKSALERWIDTDETRVTFAATPNEPLAVENEPVQMSYEPEAAQPIELATEVVRPVELAPEPQEDADSEWTRIVLEPLEEPSEAQANVILPEDADTDHSLVAGEIDLRSFLDALEERRQEPDVDAGVERESRESLACESLADEEPAQDVAAFTEDSAPVRKPTAETESWRALSLTPRRWPRLEGVMAELPRAAVAPDVTAAGADAAADAEAVAMEASEPVREGRAAPRPESGRSEWLDMLDALRRDIERLRLQRTEAGAAAPIEPVQAVAPSGQTDAATAPRKKSRKKKYQRPVQDEWGFFDPEQCGFTALLAKLDEISNSSDETGTWP
jgi:hypothetical protein